MAFSKLLDAYLEPDVPIEEESTSKKTKSSSATSSDDTPLSPFSKFFANDSRGVYSLLSRFIVLAPATAALILFVHHCTWVTSNAYSSPSVVLASRNQDGSQHIIDDFREAYYWLRQNTKEDAVIMSWWDYGYQIAGMADRVTMVDNNTWNNSRCREWCNCRVDGVSEMMLTPHLESATYSSYRYCRQSHVEQRSCRLSDSEKARC